MLVKVISALIFFATTTAFAVNKCKVLEDKIIPITKKNQNGKNELKDVKHTDELLGIYAGETRDLDTAKTLLALRNDTKDFSNTTKIGGKIFWGNCHSSSSLVISSILLSSYSKQSADIQTDIRTAIKRKLINDPGTTLDLLGDINTLRFYNDMQMDDNISNPETYVALVKNQQTIESFYKKVDTANRKINNILKEIDALPEVQKKNLAILKAHQKKTLVADFEEIEKLWPEFSQLVERIIK